MGKYGYMCVCTCARARVCVCVCVRVYVPAYVCTYMRACVPACVCVCVCTRECACACVCTSNRTHDYLEGSKPPVDFPGLSYFSSPSFFSSSLFTFTAVVVSEMAREWVGRGTLDAVTIDWVQHKEDEEGTANRGFPSTPLQRPIQGAVPIFF